MSAPCPIFGFEVVFHVVPALDDAAQQALREAFLLGPVEGRGLVCGGGIDGAGRWSHLVHAEAGQATDADRQAMAAWAAGRAEIVRAEIGPLVDLASDD